MDKMKIINREQFLKMPADTLYSKYTPCSFEQIEIKGMTRGEDFDLQRLSDAIEHDDSSEFFDLLNTAEKKGISLKMDFDCQVSDNLFDNSLFAVWEQKDIKALIKRLSRLIK
jgi:hypothetical protein